MAYRIENIELYVREMPAPRMDFRLGAGKSLFPPILRSALTTRLLLSDTRGRSAFGCSADWLSVGWLDNRPDLLTEEKLQELVALVETARDVYLEGREFETPFDLWLAAHGRIVEISRERGCVALCAAFASAQMAARITLGWLAVCAQLS